MFYQTEYAALVQVVSLIQCQKLEGRDNAFTSCEDAQRITQSIFGIESFDIEDLPHAWNRPALDEGQISKFCERFEKTLKFNTVVVQDYMPNVFKEILEGVAKSRELKPSSFVLYGEWDFEGDFSYGGGLILVDQVNETAWAVNCGIDDSSKALCLSPLYCHAMSEESRSHDLTLVDLDDEFLRQAVKASPRAFNEVTELEDMDGFVERTDFQPLAIVRDGMLYPARGMDKVEIDSAWFWYITGFPGFTMYAHWEPEDLFQEFKCDNVEFEEIRGGNWYSPSSIVLASGFVVSSLASRGLVKLTENASLMESKMFRFGYDILGLTELLSGIMASGFTMWEADPDNAPDLNITGHNLYSMKEMGRIPTQQSEPDMNVAEFLLKADDIFLFRGESLEMDLLNSWHFNSPSLIAIGCYVLKGKIDGTTESLVGIHDIELSVSGDRLHRAVSRFISNLTQKELCSLVFGASEIGFDDKGKLALSDPTHYVKFTNFFSHEMLRPCVPLISCEGDVASMLFEDSLPFALPDSVQKVVSDHRREWDAERLKYLEPFSDIATAEKSPFKMKVTLEAALDSVAKKLFERLDESELKQIMVDNISISQERMADICYQSCQMIEGAYVSGEGSYLPKHLEFTALLETSVSWMEIE